MRTRIFSDNPQSTIEAVKLLIFYFRDGRRDLPVIHAKAIKRASRLLKLMSKYDPRDASVSWVRSKEWRSRLELAGLDPESLEIVDSGRWDLAWEQMAYSRTFRDDIQVRNLALGRVAAKAEPYLEARVMCADGKYRRQKEEEEKRSVIDYMSAEQRRGFRRRK